MFVIKYASPALAIAFNLIFFRRSMIHSYLVISLIAFSFWFACFWQDDTTHKNDLDSWFALLFGSMFWFITLPLSIWESIEKFQANQSRRSRYR